MKLTSALFLDQAPFDFYVAYRTDGVKGTGSNIDDPYNGSTSYAPAVSVTSLTHSGADALEATATTDRSHGYSDGDAITIDGATGDGSTRWNGTFPIYGTTATTLKYRMTGAPPAGPATGGPFTASKVTRFNFDDAMNRIPTGAAVWLGPTTEGRPFLTRGYADGVSGGLRPKAGMRIIGSGVDTTTIQLVPAAVASAHFFAFGHDLATGSPPAPNRVDGLSIANLTIDCNFALPASTAAACGAARIMGDRSVLSRVKAINWGSTLSNHPAFVFAVILADPATPAITDVAGIEDCTAVEPATCTTGEVLILHAGAKDFDATQNIEAFGHQCYIRDCFVDCDANGDLGDGTDYRSKLRALSINSCVYGLVERNQIQNTWIGGPYLTKWSARQLVIRQNTYRNVFAGPYVQFLAAGAAFSISTLTRLDPDPATTTTAEAMTSSAHPLVAGDRVLVAGASQAAFNGVFVITLVPNATKFQYVMASRPTANSTGTPSAKKVLGVEKLVVERNLIELAPVIPATVPIAIHLDADSASAQIPSDYVSGDVTIRENVVRYLDGQFDPSFFGYAMSAKGARNLSVLENLVESAPIVPLQNSLCGLVDYLENRTVSGELIGLIDPVTGKIKEELDVPVEDAIVVASFSKP